MSNIFRRSSLTRFITLVVVAVAVASTTPATAFETGTPKIESMSALGFSPDGVLLIGDGKAGAVFAVELSAQEALEYPNRFQVQDLEGKIGALLGTTADQVMVHDLAVHPKSHEIYLAVSRGRSGWETRWQLPNHVADASVLLRADADGKLLPVSLEGVRFARAELTNPVDAEKKHRWLEASLRTDTITDLEMADGVLWVAGLSNEEFASTVWKIPYPFDGKTAASTLEIYHGAHGAYETHAPIRTFVPYALKGKSQLLAAYLCTPLVTFETEKLVDGEHVKGRTVAEFGSGNYPLDMVVYEKDGKQKLLIANSNLPLMIVDPDDIAAYEGEISTELSTYTAGIPFESRSGTGIQQLALLNEEQFVALQRLPGGGLDMVALSVRRF